MPTLEEQMKVRGLEPAATNFTEPWQARAFALALALTERGSFEWEDFRRQLIAAIARADADAAQSGNSPEYYACWLEALEAAITAKSLARREEIDHHAKRIAAHPPAPTKAAGAGPIKIA